MRKLTHDLGLELCNSKANPRFKLIAFVVGVIGIFIPAITHANNDVSGTVISVIDGNTLEVSNGEKEKHKLLLFGIDSPELGQEYGDQAKEFLKKLVLNKNVTVQFKGKDRMGNYLAVVIINGIVDPRVELLKEGSSSVKGFFSSVQAKPSFNNSTRGSTMPLIITMAR